MPLGYSHEYQQGYSDILSNGSLKINLNLTKTFHTKYICVWSLRHI